jgi:hypothetical protein
MYRQGIRSIQVILEGFGFRLGPQEVLGPFLDLPYTLATQPKHLADLFQGFGFVIEAKAQAEDLLLTRRDLAEKLVNLLSEGRLDVGFFNGGERFRLQEVEMTHLAIVADRSIEGEVAAVYPEDGLHLFGGQGQLFADLGAGGFDSGAMDVLPVALGDLMQGTHLFER